MELNVLSFCEQKNHSVTTTASFVSFFSLFLHSYSKISHKSPPKLSSDDYEGHSNSE